MNAVVSSAKNQDFVVADLSLADWGRKEMAIAETEMPGLMAVRREFEAATRLHQEVRAPGALQDGPTPDAVAAAVKANQETLRKGQSVGTDDLDEKLARLGRRVEARRDAVRAALAESPEVLQLAEDVRARFGAKLPYVRVGDLEQGSRAAFEARGQAYNVDLRPNHAATRSADADAEGSGASKRSGDEPYRGRTTGRKRSPRKAGRGGPRGRDPVAWIDGRWNRHARRSRPLRRESPAA